jgi:nitrite reductase/ring-hydroxylating ferredoxin subunit
MTFEMAIKVSDVPATGVAKAKVGKHELAIVKFGGNYYCFDGVCTHEGGPLGEGTIEGDELVCPWHEGKYKIESGEADPETDWVTDTKTFKTKVEGGYVWIDL